MRIALALVLASGPLLAASITSNGNGGGNWASGSTWSGGVTPGAGDTVTLANGDTVTVPAGTSVTVGSSPGDDTGTPTIQCASSTGTGALAVNGSLAYRGPMRMCANTVMGPGAVLTHDSSGYTTAAYTLTIQTTTSTATGAPALGASQVGKQFMVTGGSGCTAGRYFMLSLASGPGTFSTDGISAVASMGTAGSNCTAVLLPNYSWQQLNGSTLSLNGSAASRITVGIANGSGNTGPFMGPAEAATNWNMTAAYADLSNIGYLNNNVALGSPSTGAYSFFTNQGNSTTFQWAHVTIKHSAPIGWLPSATGVFTLDDVSMADMLAAANTDQLGLFIGTATTTASAVKTTGTRRIDSSYFHNAGFGWYVNLTTTTSQYYWGLQYTNNWHSSVCGVDGACQWQNLSGHGFPFFAAGEWSGNILYNSAPGPGVNPHASAWVAPAGVLQNSYMMADEYNGSYPNNPILDTYQTNSHPVTPPGAPLKLSGFVFEPYNGNNTGKALLPQNSTYYGANWTLEVTKSLYLCGQGVYANGWSWVEAYQPSDGVTVFGPRIVFHQNTACGNNRGYGGEPAGVASEGNSSWAGQFQGIYNNISWVAIAGQAGVLQSSANVAFTAGAFAGLNDYNWRYNGTGTYYRDAADNAYVTTPGTHDATGNPQFVDTTRNFLAWCQTLNAADTTWHACQQHFAQRGTASVDVRYSVPALIGYVQAGFAPTTYAARYSSAPGSTVGYVGAIPPAGMGVFPLPGGFQR